MVVVSDFTNLPLRYYQDLPDKISTMVEGWLLEAWFRLNPDLTLDDILDRMPNLNRDAVGREKLRKNMTEKRTAFRLKARCISWSINGSQNAMKDRELQHLLLLPQNHDCLRLNTTIDLEDRTMQELRQLKEDTKASGKYGASKRRPGADAARNTSKQNNYAPPTTSVPQPTGSRPSCIMSDASVSKGAPMELSKNRKRDSSYVLDEGVPRTKPSKRRQQAEDSISDWQTQDSGYSSPSAVHALLEDEDVDDGRAMLPMDGNGQTHMNAIFTSDAEVSDEEFQRQIDHIMSGLPAFVESPGTAAFWGPPSTPSSTIPTPEMHTLSQGSGWSSSQGSDGLSAGVSTPALMMASPDNGSRDFDDRRYPGEAAMLRSAIQALRLGYIEGSEPNSEEEIICKRAREILQQWDPTFAELHSTQAIQQCI